MPSTKMLSLGCHQPNIKMPSGYAEHENVITPKLQQFTDQHSCSESHLTIFDPPLKRTATNFNFFLFFLSAQILSGSVLSFHSTNLSEIWGYNRYGYKIALEGFKI